MAPEQSNLKAALWMGGSITCFLVMSVGGRAASKDIDVFQLLELRTVIGLAMLYPLVRAAGGLAAMKTGRPVQHVARNLVHYAGQFSWFYALTLIPLAQLISIEFTMPFWGAILAVLFLGERLNVLKAAAVILGVIGVAIIVRPGVASIDAGHLVMLFGAFCFAVSVVMVKSLTRTESVVRILFWMLVVQSVIGLVPAILVWKNPQPETWLPILVVAFTGTFSHYCLTRALSHADATFVMPIDFLRVPLSAVIGYMLYAEQVDIYTAAGAALILCGNLLNLFARPAVSPAEATVAKP
ncbi:MAG: DMT family transporter [Rhizobiaceae bacterium]|nr:DMT family transporter [Rhizobiaceae bacterium]